MMATPSAAFAVAWRRRLASALNGSWSNHSGFLASRLRMEMPQEVHVEKQESFFPALCTPADVRRLLEGDAIDVSASYSVHLWAHVWWNEQRRDFCDMHAGMFTCEYVQTVDTMLNRQMRPYLPRIVTW
jgi:hypothetical protein